MATDDATGDESRLQQAVFAFLADPATHRGAEVRRFGTHSSEVFLAGDRAYKVKRAVKFPFLDYSTLAKRESACRAELEVNRNFAPELYLGVVPITRGPTGRLELDGGGTPVEWAVGMVRFDENRTLDRLADGDSLSDATAAALADACLAMHARAPLADASEWLQSLAAYLDQNAEAFGEQPSLFPAEPARRLDTGARAALERLRPLILSRGREGLVRRGHGDLHLGNIVLLQGRPVPFDAIEFDPRVAAGDVLYDLAFLLMDLAERGMLRPANIVLNGYLGGSGRVADLDGLAALPFFLSLRAAIRAKVTASRLVHAKPAQRPAVETTAREYFDFALAALSPPPPRLVAVGGLSGTGKSSVARLLAPHIAPIPGAVLLRSDVERKRLFGVPETEPLPPAAYGPDATERVYRTLEMKARRIVGAGHSAIVDAVFAREAERKAVADAAADAQAEFSGLFLTADLAVRLRRVGSRRGDASDANADVARAQEAYDLGRLDWTRVDASGSIETTETLALSALRLGPARG